tara:strand:+ start:7867 stop:8481 length:615 start_codon:yes stop_codon:yes gene_type:complete
MDKYNFNTGDILLCIGKKNRGGIINNLYCFIDDIIQYFSNSIYTHCGIILKDPMINDIKMKGIYVWESSLVYNYVDSPGYKPGVKVVPVEEFIEKYNGYIDYRKIKLNHIIYESAINKINETVKNKPYDIVPYHWLEAAFHIDLTPQRTDRFWCSALLGYVFVKLELLPKKVDWSILSPGEFSSCGDLEKKYINCSFEKELRIK